MKNEDENGTDTRHRHILLTMKYAAVLVALVALLGADAFQTPKPASKPVIDLKKAAVGAFAALTIGSSVLSTPLPAVAVDTFSFSSTNIIAEKVVRQGMYQDYTVDIDQKYDDARSTFKDAKETKSKKGKYTAILAILVVGSFIIPMAQYFWYVRDDDSSEKFFEPEPEPKKKKWF